MTEKLRSLIPVWSKYLPAIKILIKKSAAGEQVLGMNRSDFDKAVGLRKAGYRFVINFTAGKPDGLFSGNDFAQSFITVLQSEETIQNLLSSNNYSFTFTGKYQLQITHTGLVKQPAQAVPEEEVSHTENAVVPQL